MARRMPLERGDDLEVEVTADSMSVRSSETAAVVLVRGEHHGMVQLRFGRGRAGVDVSVQPGAVLAVITDQARAAGVDPNRWMAQVLDAVIRWCPELTWCRGTDGLASALGAFTHPLLGEAYRRGGSPITDVPRWASSVLRSSTPDEAVRGLLGSPPNRRLTRVLAAGLLSGDGRVDLGPLAFAVAAARVVSADDLSNVIEAASRSGRRDRPLEVEEVRAIRTGLGHYPASRRAGLLVDAATNHGPIVLATVMARFAWVADRAPAPLPTRVAPLLALCDRLVPVLAPPRPIERVPEPSSAPVVDAPVADTPVAATRPAVVPEPVMPVRAPRRVALVERAAPVRAGTTPMRAPPTSGARLERWAVPAALRPVDRLRHRDLSFSVPTSAAELAWWSRQLHNCLDTFALAAARERSWLVGIHRDDLLIGCVEVCPRTRRIRQALGPRNRPLPASVHDATVAVLTQAGLVASST